VYGLPPAASPEGLNTPGFYIIPAARTTAPAIPAAAETGTAVMVAAPPVKWAEVAVLLALAATDTEDSTPETEACT
jgi:hypothetical protein